MILSIRTDNPFFKSITYKFADGTLAIDREKLVYSSNSNDKIHLVKDFDTLDAIAFTYYNNPKFWWLIADANNIENPFVLPIGKTLVIPDLIKYLATS